MHEKLAGNLHEMWWEQIGIKMSNIFFMQFIGKVFNFIRVWIYGEVEIPTMGENRTTG